MGGNIHPAIFQSRSGNASFVFSNIHSDKTMSHVSYLLFFELIKS